MGRLGFWRLSLLFVIGVGLLIYLGLPLGQLVTLLAVLLFYGGIYGLARLLQRLYRRGLVTKNFLAGLARAFLFVIGFGVLMSLILKAFAVSLSPFERFFSWFLLVALVTSHGVAQTLPAALVLLFLIGIPLSPLLLLQAFYLMSRVWRGFLRRVWWHFHWRHHHLERVELVDSRVTLGTALERAYRARAERPPDQESHPREQTSGDDWEQALKRLDQSSRRFLDTDP